MTSTSYDTLICDDHPICQMGIELSLKSLPDINFNVRKANSGHELLCLFDQRRPDLLILDLGLPDTSGLNLIRLIREKSPGLKIIVITSCENIATLQNVLNAKVDALLAKTHSLQTLAAVFRGLNTSDRNPLFIDPAIQSLISAPEIENLTPREWEVLELIARGQSNRDIAETLACSLETVKTHRANLGRKILARNRSELTAWYLQRNGKANPSVTSRG